MRDFMIIFRIVLALLVLMYIIFLCSSCTIQREIYTRNFQVYGNCGDTSAVLYMGNKFFFNGKQVTRVNAFGDSFSYSKDRVKIIDGAVQVTDNINVIVYRP